SLPGREAAFTYQRGLADDSFMSLLYGQPTSVGVFAGAFSYYTAGDIELIDLDGNEWTAKAEQDFVITGGFAREVSENWPVGINLKIVSSRLVEVERGTAFAVDLGGLYYTPIKGLAGGLAIRNLGTKLKFLDESDSLPLTICVGGAYQKPFGNQKILVSVDFPFLVYEQIVTPAVGVEFDWQEMLQGRIGYKFNIDDTGLALGMGFTYQNYSINYAFGLVDRLENGHRVSLGVRF
ncbi:MAG: PorV/PorQ family protein, partial [bacterium]